jgi:hypothetical protein
VRRRLLITAVLSLALGGATSASVSATPGAPDGSDAAKGRSYKGLVKADAKHCKGHGFYLANHPDVCTHGPDDAPGNVDVRTRRTTEELQARGKVARQQSGGNLTNVGSTVGTSTPSTDGTGQVVCEGDGTTGPRVQVLYVHASDVPSRFAALQDTIGSYMLNMDAKYNASAQETGGARHVRFVTEPSASGPCQLSLREVVITPTGDDSFNNTITDVKAAGWDAGVIGQPRKFVMLVDANVLCGIGSIYGDDSPGQTNYNNSVAGMYDRSDNGCWDYAEPHELMHNIGGVQLSAPHTSGGYHCNDEYDIECYNDGGATSTLQYLCPSSHEQRFDCNHDDYYSTNPPANSYLATHWNAANSKFLINPGTPPADTTAPAVPTGVAASASGATVTVTWVLGSDADLAGYRVYRNGAQVGTTGKTGSWSEPVANGTYTYTVASVDTTGNVSAPSSGSTVTVNVGPTQRSESLSGKFGKSGTASLTRTVAPGATSAGSTSYVQVKGKRTNKPITVRVTDASGAVVATGSGTGSATVTWTAPASGPLTWTLVGSNGAFWTLSLTYWA